MRKPRAFKMYGEVTAWCEYDPFDELRRVHFSKDAYDEYDARRLAAWLLKAAEWSEAGEGE